MTNIIKFYPEGAANNPDAVLEQAVGEYQQVLILGINRDGEFEARANLSVSNERALWLMKKMEWLMQEQELEVMYIPDDAG